jgi:sirohydrochlorin cobaltochelatase
MLIINEQTNPAKYKAILVVSFGTTYPDTLKRTILKIEDKIRERFPDFAVRRAFTSRIVIKKLAQRDGVQIDTEKQALEKLLAEGYREVYIQPLHVIAGEEYEKIEKLVFQYEKAFDKIRLGRPLLYHIGPEGHPDDYVEAIRAVERQLPELGSREALVFMGHGGVHPANGAYAVLQLKLEEAGWRKLFVYTVEGFPSLQYVMEKLKRHKVEKVALMPFMLVAGDHANNDMAGEEADSAKSCLMAAGFSVEVYLCGLGENEKIQDIYISHLQDSME